MDLWEVITAWVFAWISGVLFGLSLKLSAFRRTAHPEDHAKFNERATSPIGPWHWVLAPATLIQLGLLAAFLAAGVLLIVLSL